MKRVGISLVRLTGYILAAVAVVIWCLVDFTDAWITTWWLWLLPMLACAGVAITQFNAKTLPISKREKRMSNIFDLLVIMLVVIRLVWFFVR